MINTHHTLYTQVFTQTVDFPLCPLLDSYLKRPLATSRTRGIFGAAKSLSLCVYVVPVEDTGKFSAGPVSLFHSQQLKYLLTSPV